MWAGVSSCTPHLLHKGLLEPHQVKMSSQATVSSKKANPDPGLCPIKGQILVFALRVGPKINSRAYLWVLPRTTYPSKSLIKEPPSMFPNMFPMERDSVSRASGLFIHLYALESPVQEPSHVSGENIWTPYVYPRGQKAYIQWGVVWFPNGIVYDTAITTLVPCNLQHHTFHLVLGRPEPC